MDICSNGIIKTYDTRLSMWSMDHAQATLMATNIN